jgi:tetratricopeptide (TPR) repeat protein
LRTPLTSLQPDYALGWSGVSEYYAASAVDGNISPEDSLAPGEAAARKAVELDDSLSEAPLALGAILFVHRWDWAAAEQEISRSIELDPQFAEGYHLRAKMRNALSRNDEAIEAEKRAQELAPFQRPFGMAYAYLLARQYDAAINDARSKIETQPGDPWLHWALWETYRRKGDGKNAAEELEKMCLALGDKGGAENTRQQFARGGYTEVLRGQLEYYTSLSSKQYVSPVWLATLHAGLGNREQTLALLEEGYRQHSPQLLWVQNDPAFDFVHNEDFRAFIRREGGTHGRQRTKSVLVRAIRGRIPYTFPASCRKTYCRIPPCW